MTKFQNVSGDVVELPHLGLRVLPGEVIDVDADLSANPLFAAPKPAKRAEGGAVRPARAHKPKQTAPAAPAPTEPADAATEGTK
jgi:hypothetical protein